MKVIRENGEVQITLSVQEAHDLHFPLFMAGGGGIAPAVWRDLAIDEVYDQPEAAVVADLYREFHRVL